jgi:hypothetical protein
VIAVCTRVSMPSFSEEVLQGQAVHDRAEHAHVVGAVRSMPRFCSSAPRKEVAAATTTAICTPRLVAVALCRCDALHDVGVDPTAPQPKNLAGKLSARPAGGRSARGVAISSKKRQPARSTIVLPVRPYPS